MTESPPLAPRISMIFPAAALLCAGAVGPALDRLDGLESGPVLKGLFAALLGLALFVPNYNHYFSKYSEADIFWPWVEPNRAIGEHLADLDTQTQVLLFRTPGAYAAHPILDFLRRAGPGSDVEVIDVLDWQGENFDLQGTMRRELRGGPAELLFTKEGSGLAARIQNLCPAANPQITMGPLEASNKSDVLFIAILLIDSRCLTGSQQPAR